MNCCGPTMSAGVTYEWGMIPSAESCLIGRLGIGGKRWMEGSRACGDCHRLPHRAGCGMREEKARPLLNTVMQK